MSLLRTALLAGAVMLSGTAAQAASITFGVAPTIGTGGLSPTDFSILIGVPKFDSTLGTLTGISFTLSGSALISVGIESQDADATTVSSAVTATISLQRPDLTNLVVTVPTYLNTQNFTAFDGNNDFGGTSGFESLDNVASDSDTVISNSAADFALFSQAGGGTISLNVDANGDSAFEGSANLLSQVSTDASASVLVTYTYDVEATDVPEPASMALIGAGLFGLGMARRRKV